MGLPTAWVLAIVYFLFFLAILIWSSHLISTSFTYVFFVLGLLLTIILVNDICLSPIREKWFWIISMFVLLPIASITYLAKRKSLIIIN